MPAGDKKIPTKPIEQVLKEHTDELMEIPGVVGTAQTLCEGEPCIMIMAATRTPEIEKQIPDRLEGYRVRIQVTGEFEALEEDA